MSAVRSWSLIIIVAMMLAVSGCRSLTPSVSYYTIGAIESSSESEVADNDRQDLTIGIRGVDVPGYINRKQMMRRTSAYRLEISSYHRWADYPDRLVQQLIGENLQTLLPHVQVVNVPWPIGFKPDFLLSLQIESLIGSDDQKVSLTAVWTLSRGDGTVAIRPRKAILFAPMANKGFESLAEAHSKVLAELCRQMAIAIDNFQEER